MKPLSVSTRSNHVSQTPMRMLLSPLTTSSKRSLSKAVLAALGAATLVASCQTASVQTFRTPEEATGALIEAAERGDVDEASRIFDTFARASVQRDRVYARAFDAAMVREDAGEAVKSANILKFVCEKYPGATSAREALAYSLWMERNGSEEASEGQTKDLRAAINDVRSATSKPAVWMDLAETQVAIDEGDLDRAREAFGTFLFNWDGTPVSLMAYVEELERFLQTH